MGILTTATGTFIPVPLTEEEEAQQINEMLQRGIMEKRATNVPYLEGVGPSKFDLQKKALKEAVRRKTEIEATKVRGKGTSAQGGMTSA